MAAAYAALLALARSLREILDLDKYIDPLHKEKIVSLKEKVDFIVAFLEDYSDKYQETLVREGNGIREAAYEAQDFMDSYQCSVSTIDDDGSTEEAEIPSGIGEIDTLRFIELQYCKKSLVISAKQMQKHQHENGNDAFRVRVIDYNEYDVLF